MPTFTPPFSAEVPPILPETRGLQRKLWRHCPMRGRGINVYILDGVVSLSSPTGRETTVSVFYGGHGPITVTTAEGDLLTAAGYTVT